MSRDGLTHVARTGLFVAFAGAACRFVSLGKELLVAFLLGAGVATDGYALLMLLPSFAMALLVHSARSAFLTQFARYADQSRQEGERFANRFLCELTALAVLIMALLIGPLHWAWPWLFPHAAPELVETSRQLLPIAGLLVVLVTLGAALSAILNARGSFTAPQWTALLPTLTIVAGLLIWQEKSDAATLLISMLAGVGLQTIVLFWLTRQSGHAFQWRLGFGQSQSRTLWHYAAPVLGVSVLSQVNVYVDRSMATSLDSGAVAILTWSGTLRDFISGTIIGGFLSVLLPYFTRQATREDRGDLALSCMTTLRLGAVILFPLSGLVVLILPDLLGSLTLGSLDQTATALIGLCVAGYACGFYMDLSSNALAAALLALGRASSLLWISLLASFLPNIVFNLLLIRWLGAPGLALSTSIVGLCTLLANYLVLRNCVAISEEVETGRSILGALLATLLATAAMGAFVASGGLPAGPFSDIGHAVWWSTIRGLGLLLIYAFLMLVFPGHQAARHLLRSLLESARTRRKTRTEDPP
jgi:putative peptidoglycan lipid II flippase